MGRPSAAARLRSINHCDAPTDYGSVEAGSGILPLLSAGVSDAGCTRYAALHVGFGPLCLRPALVLDEEDKGALLVANGKPIPMQRLNRRSDSEGHVTPARCVSGASHTNTKGLHTHDEDRQLDAKPLMK